MRITSGLDYRSAKSQQSSFKICLMMIRIIDPNILISFFKLFLQNLYYLLIILLEADVLKAISGKLLGFHAVQSITQGDIFFQIKPILIFLYVSLRIVLEIGKCFNLKFIIYFFCILSEFSQNILILINLFVHFWWLIKQLVRTPCFQWHL